MKQNGKGHGFETEPGLVLSHLRDLSRSVSFSRPFWSCFKNVTFYCFNFVTKQHPRSIESSLFHFRDLIDFMRVLFALYKVKMILHEHMHEDCSKAFGKERSNNFAVS